MMSDNDFIAKVCNYDFKNFINYNNVLGIAKGKKIKNGIYTSDNCLTIFVEKKLPSNLLNKNEFIPSLYKGIKTDVVETGKISSLSLISRNRPVIGGYSAGVIGSTAGTIGCTATNENSTEYYLLSNNHVFANENRAKIGTPILQPGPYDGGNIENDIIGYLADYEPISFSTSNRSPKNYIDAAIALCDYNDISNIIALQGAITGTTQHREVFKKQTGGRGKFADIIVEIGPADEGVTGLQFDNQVKGGNVPKEFVPCVQKGFESAMANGVLAGYEVQSLKVTLLDGSYHPVDSDQLSFELAARMAFRHACPKCKPVLLEPIMNLEVVTPEDYMGEIVGDLNRRRGQIVAMDSTANGARVVKAFVPLSEQFGYVTVLRTLSSGRATSTMSFDHYAEVPAAMAKDIIEKSGYKASDDE